MGFSLSSAGMLLISTNDLHFPRLFKSSIINKGLLPVCKISLTGLKEMINEHIFSSCFLTGSAGISTFSSIFSTSTFSSSVSFSAFFTFFSFVGFFSFSLPSSRSINSAPESNRVFIFLTKSISLLRKSV